MVHCEKVSSPHPMRFFFLLVLFCAFNSCFAQSWTPASVVNSNGDSIRGEILFKDWNISPAAIEFRSQQQAVVNANDITAFKIYQGNRSFERVNILLKYYKPIVVQYSNPVDREVPTNVFAEVIYSNALVRLYSLGDEDKTERFLIKMEGQNIVELVNFSFRISTEKGTFQRDNQVYQKQLGQMLSDCDFGGTTSIVYQEKAIIRVLDKYSNCKGITATKSRQGVKGLVNGGLMLASTGVPTGYITSTKLVSVPGTTMPVSTIRRDQQQAPVVGIALQILSRKRFGNRFSSLEGGIITGHVPTFRNIDRVYYAIYLGTFFGKGKIQGLVFTGASRYSGFLDTGLGISYKKKLTLVANGGFVNRAGIAAFSIKLRYHPRFKATKA
jgi:hypothetical protein